MLSIQWRTLMSELNIEDQLEKETYRCLQPTKDQLIPVGGWDREKSCTYTVTGQEPRGKMAAGRERLVEKPKRPRSIWRKIQTHLFLKMGKIK